MERDTTQGGRSTRLDPAPQPKSRARTASADEDARSAREHPVKGERRSFQGLKAALAHCRIKFFVRPRRQRSRKLNRLDIDACPAKRDRTVLELLVDREAGTGRGSVQASSSDAASVSRQRSRDEHGDSEYNPGERQALERGFHGCPRFHDFWDQVRKKSQSPLSNFSFASTVFFMKSKPPAQGRRLSRFGRADLLSKAGWRRR